MRFRSGRLAAVLILAGSTTAIAADAPAPVRTFLRRVDATPNQEVIVATVDTPAGAQLFRHRHHGVEIGYVVSGEVELLVDGQPPRIYKAGDSFMVPRETPHAGHPVGGGPARTLSTYVVDKGLPLVEAVP